MPEIYSRQPDVLYKFGFTYRTCGPFTKTKDRKQFKKTKKTEHSWYIHQNELDKACFQCMKLSTEILAEELYKPVIKKFEIYSQYLVCWSCWYEINQQG